MITSHVNLVYRKVFRALQRHGWNNKITATFEGYGSQKIVLGNSCHAHPVPWIRRSWWCLFPTLSGCSLAFYDVGTDWALPGLNVAAATSCLLLQLYTKFVFIVILILILNMASLLPVCLWLFSVWSGWHPISDSFLLLPRATIELWTVWVAQYWHVLWLQALHSMMQNIHCFGDFIFRGFGDIVFRG